MTVQRFHDETIDQYSYLISDGGEAVAIDPPRRIEPYFEYLRDQQLTLRAIVMTHRPGAFASGWAELRELTGAEIVGAAKFHFHGEGLYREAGRATMIEFGEGCHVRTQLTPGYTADSISLIATNADGKVEAIFTGNVLLQDGAGYPLPRPEDKNPLHNERTYAKESYESIYGKIRGFDQRATVYAGFGEDAHFSKMGDATHGRFNLTEAQDESPVFDKKIKNADQFADWLLEDYPFVPAYVTGCLAGNQEGYPSWAEAMAPFRSLLDGDHQHETTVTQPVVEKKGNVVIIGNEEVAPAGTPTAPATAPAAIPLGTDTWLIDTRPAADFKAGHPRNAINIQAKGNFALWLGSIVRPGEDFYVLVEDGEAAYQVAQGIAKIGYDKQLTGATRYVTGLAELMEEPLDLEDFREHHIGKYTVVDVRPAKPAMEDTRFYGAINIPVWTLRDRWKEVPQDRPIVVHCGGGYQSAIGASLLRKNLKGKVKVYDLGEHIKDFKPGR
ncbi:Hydroxyacylglutathione hydrolase [Neolewinella maritima]|uniref:Hydroxyacylglutathione hydrolase n=1 Tax=Neolewinella maritima TaxID=1383882 RepID=A0ABM9B2A9_9BACT|nr:rhodanese-like domain-containing protein [Neolewinella maritima]CAH1001489.1 Hydroxyacylglutathione hydrolase [Neolewinella maritima]